MKKNKKKVEAATKESDKKKSRKSRFWLGFGIFVVIFFAILTFFQSSFFFCEILLPGICKIYNVEIVAGEIDVSLFRSKFSLKDITVKDKNIGVELKIDQVDGAFYKWGIFKKEYFFHNLTVNHVQLNMEVTDTMVKKFFEENNLFLPEKIAQNSNSFAADLKSFLSTFDSDWQREYLQQRMPNVRIGNLKINDFDLNIKYGNVNDPGVIAISDLKFDWVLHDQQLIKIKAASKVNIREPYSKIEKIGTLSYFATLERDGQSRYFIDSKLQIDIPGNKEKFLLELDYDSAESGEDKDSLCKIIFESNQGTNLTSSIKLDTYWKNENEFSLKLHEAFVAPSVVKFVSELIYGKSFGVFGGKVSAMMFANPDEIIFNVFGMVIREKDRELDKIEVAVDIASRFNRTSSHLTVSSCYAHLLLGGHKLLTLTTPEKYIYNIDRQESPKDFKFDISIDNFDMKLVDYFCMYDSNFHFVGGQVSAVIKSEFDSKNRKIISEISGEVDNLHATLHGEDYFSINGDTELRTELEIPSFFLNAESKKIHILNNLQDRILIADAYGKGWADFRENICDFQVDIFNGNERVFDVFVETRDYVQKFPVLKQFNYALSCGLCVLNEQSFDLKNAKFTVKRNDTDELILLAESTPIELAFTDDYETNLEYNLNPITVKVITKDHESILLGSCIKNLYGLRSELVGEMVFGKDFKDWRIDECNLQIFDGSKVLMSGNGTMLMDFDAASKTDITLNLNCSEEQFIEQLTGYDFCNEFEGNWQFGMTFFNEFEDSKFTSKLELSKIKFLSHPENIFSADLTTQLTCPQGKIDKFENFFTGKIDGYQVVAMELHRKKGTDKDNLELDWTINYFDLLSMKEIFSKFKKEALEQKFDTYLDKQTSKEKLFDFGERKVKVYCDFDNISYNNNNKIKVNTVLDCEKNYIKTTDLKVAINQNVFDCVAKITAQTDGVEVDMALKNDTVILPLLNPAPEEEDTVKNIRGELKNLNVSLSSKITEKECSFFDNLNGSIQSEVAKLVVPNGMTNSFIGNILVYSFEVAAKLIDLLPTRLDFLQGYIDLVMKFNQNRYYELLFTDGEINLSCVDGVFQINKFILKGEAIDQFKCDGKFSFGSKNYIDLISEVKINYLVFPFYFEGSFDEIEVNMTKSIGAFMKNIFTPF